MHHSATCATVILAAALAGPAQAQSFADTTHVTLVEIPVQVTVDGKPVRGLSAADFEVFEGKKRRSIASLEVLDLSVSPRPEEEGAAAPEVRSAARRHFLLLFDLSYSEPSSLARAQQAALDLVRHGLQSSDLVGVASYSGSRGVRLILGFTTDRDQAELAIQTLGAPELIDRSPDPLGIVLGEARQGLIDAQLLVQARSGRVADELEGRRVAIADEYVDHVRSLETAEERASDSTQREQAVSQSRSFSDMALLLDRIRGRKYVVLLSEGFEGGLLLPSGSDRETRESVDAGEVWDVDGDRVFGSTRLASELQEMVATFRRSDCVIYAVDIGGVRGADEPGLRIQAEQDPRPAGVQPGGDEGQDGLFLVARGTGGELYRNFNDLSQAMDRMLEATSVTYVLTFDPRDLARDGAFHEVRVRLKGGPARAVLAHRPGYSAPRPSLLASPLEQRMELADLLFGTAGEGPIDVSLSSLALVEGEASVVPFVVGIEGTTLLAGHEPSLLSADLYLYAFDARGAVAASLHQAIGLNLLKVREGLARAGIRFFGDLELPPGHYRLRAVVRNQQADTFGVASSLVEVAAAAAGGPPRVSAVLVESPGDWLLLRERPEALAAPYPFMAAGELLVPAVRPAFQRLGSGRVWLELQGAEVAPESLAGRVSTPDGREVGSGKLDVLEAHPAGRATRLLARFEVPDLPPGEYLLQVALAGSPASATDGGLAFAVLD